MLVLDALSRAYIKISKPEFDKNSLMHHVHFVISNLPINNEHLEQLEETRKDRILQTLLKYTIKRWAEKTLILHELHPYFTYRSDISYQEGLLLKDPKINALRSEMMSILYEGHLGIENCRKRACQPLFLTTYKQRIRRHDFKMPRLPNI